MEFQLGAEIPPNLSDPTLPREMVRSLTTQAFVQRHPWGHVGELAASSEGIERTPASRATLMFSKSVEQGSGLCKGKMSSPALNVD